MEPSPAEKPPSGFDERLLGAANLTGIFRDGWNLYRRNFLGLFTLFAPGMALVFVAGSLWVLVASSVEVAVLFVAGGLLWFLLVPSMIGSALNLSAHVFMTDRLIGKETSAGRALAALRTDVPSLLQCLLLASTGAMFFGLLRPLSLIFFVWWGPPLLGTTVVLENQPFPAAWAATRGRGRGRLTRAILMLLLAAFGLSILGLTLAFPILAAIGTVAQTLFIILIFALLSAVVLPFMAAIELRLYFDIRARADERFALNTLREERSRVALRPKASNPD